LSSSRKKERKRGEARRVLSLGVKTRGQLLIPKAGGETAVYVGDFARSCFGRIGAKVRGRSPWKVARRTQNSTNGDPLGQGERTETTSIEGSRVDLGR